MNFFGLSRKYPVNRTLTAKERALRLKQKKRLYIEPRYQLSIIKMNSTFLESVDKWFGWKGVLSGVAVIIVVMMASFYLEMFEITLARQNTATSSNNDLSIMIMVTLMMGPVAGMAVRTLFKESFAYTHYPIRFNRKNRKVYVFRSDGTALSANWVDIFFTLGEVPYGGEWEIRGHILASDKETVIETFALSYLGSVSAASVAGERTLSTEDYVHAHWEFIRRYMEEGPEDLVAQVQFCMPVDLNRENLKFSIERTFYNLPSVPRIYFWTLSPLFLVISLFRVFAVHTSRIPKWTPDIEADCIIEPNDPYAISGNANNYGKTVFPGAA